MGWSSKKATRLGPAQIAVCVTAGVWNPHVRELRAAVMTTGDELLEEGFPTAPGKIRNSNRPMLLSRAASAGASTIDLGACRDEADVLREKLASAFTHADLLIVCGGMSMGTRDLVPGLLKELGFSLHVEKVAMKPGKPFIFSTPRPRRCSPIRRRPARQSGLLVRHLSAVCTPGHVPHGRRIILHRRDH